MYFSWLLVIVTLKSKFYLYLLLRFLVSLVTSSWMNSWSKLLKHRPPFWPLLIWRCQRLHWMWTKTPEDEICKYSLTVTLNQQYHTLFSVDLIRYIWSEKVLKDAVTLDPKSRQKTAMHPPLWKPQKTEKCIFSLKENTRHADKRNLKTFLRKWKSLCKITESMRKTPVRKKKRINLINSNPI